MCVWFVISYQKKNPTPKETQERERCFINSQPLWAESRRRSRLGQCDPPRQHNSRFLSGCHWRLEYLAVIPALRRFTWRQWSFLSCADQLQVAFRVGGGVKLKTLELPKWVGGVLGDCQRLSGPFRGGEALL